MNQKYVEHIPLSDLAKCHEVLLVVFGEYKLDTEEAKVLAEARRLTALEISFRFSGSPEFEAWRESL